MNFGDEDELDFEEDLPENEPNEKEEKVEECSMNECDQYLQIDCVDDEEDLLSKVALEPEKPENSVKDTEPKAIDSSNRENEKSENKSRQEENHQKSFRKIRGKNKKDRPFGTPLHRSSGSLRSYRWRPGNNFTRLNRQNVGQRLNHLKGLPLRYPKLQHFSQNYLQNQNEFVSLLGLGATSNQNLQQMNLFANCANPILEVSKNLVTNGVLGQFGNAIFNQLQFNDFSRFKGAIAADVNSKNFPVRCVNGFKTNYNRGSFNGGQQCDKERVAGHNLPEGEKELVKSKKEARLLRFKNDQAEKNDRKSTAEKPLVESLNLEDEYFKKMEEQKRKRQEIFSLKEKQAELSEKGAANALVINKESLLRKENPFDGSLKIDVKFKIKEERRNENGKEEENGSPVQGNLSFVKKEVETPVKFVRTVSKSYEELGLSKAKGGLFPKTSSVDAASQTQTEPHLTGCIVKVLNVPPSTTANDILALCSPFGNVREVKLNFPKENSVAIRFGEPKSAENFFKWYHGRVIDDHTLNVITV